VILVHGNGSIVPESQLVVITHILNERHIATLVINLLTPAEDEVYENRFKVTLLGDRLVQVTQWALQHESLGSLSLGYFGHSIGAAFALQAAALMCDHIKAVVSLSGQPELARHALTKVNAPTLLIVDALDTHVIYLNQIAYDQLKNKKKLITIERASQSLEESDVLEKAANLAGDWFDEHLVWPTLSAARQDINY
jgi:hypothetical protein